MALFGSKKNTDTDTKAPAKKDEKKAVAKTEAKTFDRNVQGVLIRPRITEKATLGIEQGKYVFEVAQEATKADVKVALKELYNVEPVKITMVRRRPQQFESRMRRRAGQRKGFKKAYVHLKKGETFDIMK